MTDLRAIAELAEEFNNDIEALQRELKRIASVKCRLKKMHGRSDYQEKMTSVLQYEEALKSARAYVAGPRKNVSTITQTDVDNLTLDETMKALKAIQSKKTHTKWLTTAPGDNDEYREACRIEQMLKDHRDAVAPKRLERLSKVDLSNMLDVMSMCNDLSAEDCINRLRQFIEEA